jgi:ParB-like chromosome segregation protein Spo0J
LYPVIIDGAGLVLDGVHRVRIARELGIEPPVSQMGHLDDDRKLHLAIGLNMRRRHLDADRRRALVRRLHEEQGLSVRKIAEVAGWSKSTIDRDLKGSPFESVLATVNEFRGAVAQVEHEDLRRCLEHIVTILDELWGRADADWKQRHRRSDVELLEWTIGLCVADNGMRRLHAALAQEPAPEELTKDGMPPADWWASLEGAARQRWAERAREIGILDRWGPA